MREGHHFQVDGRMLFTVSVNTGELAGSRYPETYAEFQRCECSDLVAGGATVVGSGIGWGLPPESCARARYVARCGPSLRRSL